MNDRDDIHPHYPAPLAIPYRPRDEVFRSPRTKFDLGNQRRLQPCDRTLAGVWNRRDFLLPDQLIHAFAEIASSSVKAASPDRPDVT